MFMEIVKISISAIKLEEIIVTFHCKAPKKPTIINMEEKQLINGKATHFKFLNTIHKINIMNAKTPNPKMTILLFFFMKLKWQGGMMLARLSIFCDEKNETTFNIQQVHQ